MANRRFTQFFNTLHTKPVLLDCNFIIDSANGNGLGLRGLKGPGIQAVYMNSTATFTGTLNSTVNVTGIASGTATLAVGMPVQGTNIPTGTKIASIVSSSAITLSASATGAATEAISYQAVGNPNPEVGHAVIVLQDNYNRYFSGFSGFVSATSGTSISSGMTVGRSYVIVSVGTTTLAQWQGVGLGVGIVPAVGVAFIASATSFSGTGRVQSSLSSNIASVEVIGDPNQTINSTLANVAGVQSGAYIIVAFKGLKSLTQSGTTHTNTVIDSLTSTAGFQVGQSIFGAGIPLGATIATITSATAITISAATTASATVTVTVPAYGTVQPLDGATAGLSFYLSSSSIIVQGE